MQFVSTIGIFTYEKKERLWTLSEEQHMNNVFKKC